MDVSQASAQAYKEVLPKLGKMQKIVYEDVKKHGPSTANESIRRINNKLSLDKMSTIELSTLRPRYDELVNDGYFVTFRDTTTCLVTGKKVTQFCDAFDVPSHRTSLVLPYVERLRNIKAKFQTNLMTTERRLKEVELAIENKRLAEASCPDQ